MIAKAEIDTAIYVYGFTLSGLVAPSVLGIDDEHAVSVYQYLGLQAIISSVSLNDFTGEAGEINLQNVAWLTPRACRHALVIDKLMDQGPVYPLSFGTLFSNLRALEQEMKHNAHAILAVIHHVTGCQEWSLEATLDRKQAVDVLLIEGLQSGRFTLPDSAGRRHLEEQKLRRNLNSDLNGWLEQCLTSLQKELQPLTHDDRSRRITDDKVLHSVYLLPVEKVSKFQQQLTNIASQYEVYGFSFRVTGPWAPYSFSHLAEL